METLESVSNLSKNMKSADGCVMIGLRAEGGGARADINEFMVRHKKLMMHEREMKRAT